jgi:hypothetical protein
VVGATTRPSSADLGHQNRTALTTQATHKSLGRRPNPLVPLFPGSFCLLARISLAKATAATSAEPPPSPWAISAARAPDRSPRTSFGAASARRGPNTTYNRPRRRQYLIGVPRPPRIHLVSRTVCLRSLIPVRNSSRWAAFTSPLRSTIQFWTWAPGGVESGERR